MIIFTTTQKFDLRYLVLKPTCSHLISEYYFSTILEEFGLKEKESRESVSITVTVNGIRKNLTDHFIYTTTDGQVWVQIDTRRPRYDEVPFIAEIRTASLGSFFLKPKSDGFSVRVRREK